MLEMIKRNFSSLSRDLKLLWAAVFCLMLGFGIYSAVLFNFATEKVGIEPDQLGIVEAIRETPGFLCVFVAALAARLAEPVLGALSLGLMAVGMAGYAWISDVPELMLWSFIWSVGFHTWMPLQSSMVLSLSGDKNKGKRLGQTWAVGSIGALAGMVVVKILGYSVSYDVWFILGSCFIAVAGIVLLGIRKDIGNPEKPRFIWRRKYYRYYALTFLEGCRKQVFITFAIYALTKIYHAKLQTIALLMVINSIINIIGGPLVGRLVDRIGERKILLVSYSMLVFVFIGYAVVRKVEMLYVLYSLDNILYLSTICLTTYLRKIALPEDMTPTLSLGVTINHLAAVVVPLAGGFLWASLGYPVTFLGGAVVVMISVVLAAGIASSQKAVQSS